MTAARRFLFRFGVLYWFSFCVPLLLEEIPWVGELVGFLEKHLAILLARHILHRELDIHPTGSGDTTADWLRFGFFFALSLIVAAVWSLADKREHPRLKRALRILIRYALGMIMFSYGSIKLLGGQFPTPGVARLLQTYGDSSPMGLLWTFMGFSKPYVIFSGAAETLGALLVLFRRTTTLGALILTAVLSNVVALNFFYDVPVKINSAHYLAMAIYLILPDARRLADLFLYNRAVAPTDQSLELPRRWMRVTRWIFKYGYLAFAVGSVGLAARAELKPHEPQYLEGYWNVTRFTRNGQPPLDGDPTRWRRMKFEFWDGITYMRWHFPDRGHSSPLFTVVTSEHTLTATTDKDEKVAATYQLTYTRIDNSHFRIEGDIAPDHLAVELERLEAKDVPLMTRGFHWINEDPYNR